MRTLLTVSLFLSLGLTRPATMSCSALRVDLKRSGNEVLSSGSAPVDRSEQGERKNITGQHNSDGIKNTFQGTSVLNFDSIHKDDTSGFVIVANGKRFYENKDIVAAIIAGGAVGVALAAALAALLIYKRQKEDNGGYILGHQRDADGAKRE